MSRIATTPAAWSNELDRTLGADTPLDTCLEQAAAIGFTGIESGYKFPEDGAALAAKLAEHGLTLASASHGLALLDRSVEDERAAMQPAIDRLKAAGGDVLVVTELSNATFADDDAPLSRRPTLEAADWESFALKLDQIATFCADQGVTCVYRHHVGTIVQTPEEIDRLMMETSVVALLFDTAQVYMGGGDPAQVLTRHLPRVRHVRLGNIRVRELTRARMSDVSMPEAVRMGVFAVPGDRDGSVDFKTCMNLLSASNYEGWVVVSAGQDPAQRKPSDEQATGFATVDGLIGRAGLAA